MLINSKNLGVKRPLLYTLAPKAKDHRSRQGTARERIPRRVPLTDRAHRVAGWGLWLGTSGRLHSCRLHFLKEDGGTQAADGPPALHHT